MPTMPHGYTNRVTRDGLVVTKSYQGPDAQARHAREAGALTGLARPPRGHGQPLPGDARRLPALGARRWRRPPLAAKDPDHQVVDRGPARI